MFYPGYPLCSKTELYTEILIYARLAVVVPAMFINPPVQGGPEIGRHLLISHLRIFN